MKFRPSRSTLPLVVLSSAALTVLAGSASAQNSAGSARSADPSVTGGAINPAAAAGEQSNLAALIDIDALTKGSDFTIFMRPDVPEAVRLKALRKLWTTDSVYNEVAPHE